MSVTGLSQARIFEVLYRQFGDGGVNFLNYIYVVKISQVFPFSCLLIQYVDQW
jgi:hypothetical protein